MNKAMADELAIENEWLLAAMNACDGLAGDSRIRIERRYLALWGLVERTQAILADVRAGLPPADAPEADSFKFA